MDILRIAEILPGPERVFQLAIFLLFWAGHSGTDRVAMGFETAVSHMADALRINGSPSDYDETPAFPALGFSLADSARQQAQVVPDGAKDRDPVCHRPHVHRLSRCLARVAACCSAMLVRRWATIGNKASMHAQHGGDKRNPYAFFRAAYHAQNLWIRTNKDPRIEKPSSLQPVESAAIIHTLNIGALEALQGATLFLLKDFQAWFVCVHAFSGMR